MTQNRFRVTYEIVTEESAAHGDFAEHGFVLPGNWHVDTETAVKDVDGEYGMSLREAVSLISGLEDSGSWFSEVDDRIDYPTGDSERRSLHPPRTITASSYTRLRRVLRAY
jgi:hypothetical protein